MKITAAVTAWARSWRVPTPAELELMSEGEALALHAALRRPAARDAVIAEMARRDAADKAAHKRAVARFARWQKRAEYDDYVHAAWLQAELDCRGVLLSRDGLASGVEPAALWSMPEPRAMRLASEELRDWWAANERMTYAQWQKHAREPQPEAVGA